MTRNAFVGRLIGQTKKAGRLFDDQSSQCRDRMTSVEVMPKLMAATSVVLCDDDPIRLAGRLAMVSREATRRGFDVFNGLPTSESMLLELIVDKNTLQVACFLIGCAQKCGTVDRIIFTSAIQM